MLAYSKLGQWLYRPEEIWPYLRQTPGPAPQGPLRAVLSDLARWVVERVEHDPDEEKFHRPADWQSPGETLWQGTGSSGEMALVLWAGATLWGLPRGQLVVGAHQLTAAPPALRDQLQGHAWVEFPELSLCVEATSGQVMDRRQLPLGYQAGLRVSPPPLSSPLPATAARRGHPALSLVG